MATRRGFLVACAGLAACGCGPEPGRPPTHDIVCPACNGTKRIAGTCAGCGGSGRRLSGKLPNPVECTGCGGTGTTAIQCPTCAGTGRVIKYRPDEPPPTRQR